MDTNAFSPLHERLRIAAGSRTYRQLGEATGLNSETVRRYMQGATPSVEFLALVCEALDINAQWLLVGDGPMKGADIRTHALGEANVSELLSAMSATLERLMDRVDRLESYMQTLETHLRAGAGDAGADSQNVPAGELVWAKNHQARKPGAPAGGVNHATADAQPKPCSRISGVIDAVSKRSRPAAD